MIGIFGKDKKLIVVSNRLPYYRKVDEWGKSSWHKAAGGLITAMEPIVKEANGIWLGWDGHPEEKGEFKDLQLLSSKELLAEDPHRNIGDGSYQIGHIPIVAKEVEEYYDRFSNSTLWALFHYFFEKCAIDYTAWETYKEINQRFAAYINQVASEEDIIWIHDYHLFLTPQYLRQMNPKLKIHFFLHIPFPHIDIFSILPWQKTITKSLLCCDTVGFHHQQYLKNFEEVVENNQEPFTTRFYVNPISIDFDLIDKTSRKPEVLKRKEEIRKTANCPKMMIGVDRIDYSKGIKERLLALELLMKESPQLKGQFYYYQLVVPSRESVESYQKLKKEVDEIVGRINGCYSSDLWEPVHYHYGTVNFEELVALYSASDIALVTPLRDGMNLVSKEYIAAQSDDDGILILSKFAGAFAEINECLAVNPYSIEEIKEATYRALHMPQSERVERMKKMRQNIQAHDINNWLQKCLKHFE